MPVLLELIGHCFTDSALLHLGFHPNLFSLDWMQKDQEYIISEINHIFVAYLVHIVDRGVETVTHTHSHHNKNQAENKIATYPNENK
ncbi:MAG: hypothetical protein E3J73_04825 [Candidatus Bathyarchaeum sp.]|nr:MAG: hypothetical protein E3J73_04825 [Candidatus Bathyarchaeum sp.]